MLELLRNLLSQKGSLSGIVIDEAEGMPSSAAYRARFKGLFRAYQRIGYTPRRDHTYEYRCRVARACQQLVARVHTRHNSDVGRQ